LVLVHATLAANAAVGGDFGAYANGTLGQSLGGGIAAIGTNPGVTLRNSILAGNDPGGNWTGGDLVDDGNNLSSDATSAFTSPGSRDNTDPKLGPLGDYGGPTPTIPLLEGSPALDGGKSDFCPPVDQRGRARSFGAACDIGAFESSPPYTVRGVITGYGENPTLLVSPVLGGVVSTVDTFCLYGLPAGSYMINCDAPNTVFAPQSRVLTIGPDAVGADFKGYRINALTPELLGNGLRLVYAGNEGQMIRWLRSTSLPGWQAAQTNTLGTSRLAELLELGAPPGCFYRVISP
jgi:hypothetical protein